MNHRFVPSALVLCSLVSVSPGGAKQAAPSPKKAPAPAATNPEIAALKKDIANLRAQLASLQLQILEMKALLESRPTSAPSPTAVAPSPAIGKTLNLSGDYSKGQERAKVAIIEYSDYQ